MIPIYSDIQLKELPAMNVASHSIISNNPEEEVMSYMKKWIEGKGLNFSQLKSFGVDVPVSEELQNQGIRGYEFLVPVPENMVGDDNVKIKRIEAGKYAILRIHDPFSNPAEIVPKGYKILLDWWKKSEFVCQKCDNNRLILEEILTIENEVYLDIYFPVG